MADEIHSTWLTSERTVPARFVRPALRFMQAEASSGLVLLLAAIVALIWANSAAGDTYFEFFAQEIKLEIGSVHILEESLKDFINDGLMAVFFFVVGLEIKRELAIGELRDPKSAALPAVAALGGMVVPALVYLLIVGGGDASRGWAIPMATDIAFSLGVVALLGSRVPTGAKLFLLALAIVDDIGAITVIAIFYTEELSTGWLLAAAGAFAFISLAKVVGIRSYVFYVPFAVLAWYFTLESGVHATLAGVALGLMTPARPFYSADDFDRRARRILDRAPADAETPIARELADHEAITLARLATESVAPLNRLEEALVNWSSWVIVPIFALANAGVRFVDIDLFDAVTHPVSLGVVAGLVFGKIAGISVASWAAVRFGWGRLPKGTTWGHVVGLAAVAGIGFTVSLFVTELAFGEGLLADRAKIGIFIGSLAAGVIGAAILRGTRSQSSRSKVPADVSA